MEEYKMVFMRNFLFKTFIAGCLLYIFSLIVTVAFWSSWAKLTEYIFSISKTDFGRLMLLFLIIIKVFLVFIVLAPCIALHWMIKKKK